MRDDGNLVKVARTEVMEGKIQRRQTVVTVMLMVMKNIGVEWKSTSNSEQ